MPMTRAGIRRSHGNHCRRRSGSGRRSVALAPESTRTTTLFWMAICARCVTRTGHSRRCCTAARSALVSRRSRSGAANRLAVATASWIARLMPTPPTGDIAWAASPMQSNPSRCHTGMRSICTVSSFTSSQAASALVAGASDGAICAMRARNASSPAA